MAQAPILVSRKSLSLKGFAKPQNIKAFTFCFAALRGEDNQPEFPNI